MSLLVTLPPNTTLASLSRLLKEPRHPSCQGDAPRIIKANQPGRMAKCIDGGFLPADDPIFNGSWTIFVPRSMRLTTAGQQNEAAAKPEQGQEEPPRAQSQPQEQQQQQCRRSRVRLRKPSPSATDACRSRPLRCPVPTHPSNRLQGHRLRDVYAQGQCLAMGMWFSEREKNLFAGHLRRDFLSSRA